MVLCTAALGERPWLAGDDFTLADAAALPYMVRARALRLSSLWDALDNVAPWPDRGEKQVSRLPLTDIFGSPSFHTMVAGYADADEPALRQLVETR